MATSASRDSPRALPASFGPWIAVAGWLVVVLAGHFLGQRLMDADPLVRIGAPPLVGTFDVRVPLLALPALALAAAALIWAPALAGRLGWSKLLTSSWAAGAAWMLALAGTRGLDAITAPMKTRYEYLGAVGRVGNLHHFVSTYVAQLSTYPTHVKGHPPGFTVLLWAMAQVGLGGATAASLLVIGVGAVAAPAALVAARSLTGEPAARAAAPFVTLAPAAVWMATSADAFFAGLTAVGIAVFVLASARRDARGDMLALGSGLLLGGALLCSYGIAPLGLIVLAVAAYRRRVRPLLIGGVGVVAMMGLAAAWGFWWPDGLNMTHTLYEAGVASRRPYIDFLVISPAAFALATGPAPWAGMTRLSGRAAWILPGAATAALLIAALTGLSKGETERIWLPFTPWILLAAGGLGRGWLASALGLGLLLELAVHSPW